MDFTTLLLCITFAGLGVACHVMYRRHTKVAKRAAAPNQSSPLPDLLATILPMLISSGLLDKLSGLLFPPKQAACPIPNLATAVNAMFPMRAPPAVLERDRPNKKPRRATARPVDLWNDIPAVFAPQVAPQLAPQSCYIVSNKSHLHIIAGTTTVLPGAIASVNLDATSPTITLKDGAKRESNSFILTSSVTPGPSCMINLDKETKTITVSTDVFQEIILKGEQASNIKAVHISGGFVAGQREQTGIIFRDVSHFVTPNNEQVLFRSFPYLGKEQELVLSTHGYTWVMKRTDATSAEISVELAKNLVKCL